MILWSDAARSLLCIRTCPSTLRFSSRWTVSSSVRCTMPSINSTVWNCCFQTTTRSLKLPQLSLHYAHSQCLCDLCCRHTSRSLQLHCHHTRVTSVWSLSYIDLLVPVNVSVHLSAPHPGDPLLLSQSSANFGNVEVIYLDDVEWSRPASLIVSLYLVWNEILWRLIQHNPHQGVQYSKVLKYYCTKS